MDGTFVKEIADRVAVPAQTAGGLTVIPQGWTLHDEQAHIKPGPTAEALGVYSLGALVDYVKANRDGLDLATMVVHVVSPQLVRLLGPIQPRARNREVYVQANANNLTDGFLGKYMPTDEFIVGLQTRFQLSPDRTAVFRLFSNISHEAVRTSSDDGITQTVTAKTGIALKADAPVPNPIVLMPFRTFREVEQPPSLFALRVNQAMQVGMFEADGGAWRLNAIADIAAWLKANLPTTVAVLA